MPHNAVNENPTFQSGFLPSKERFCAIKHLYFHDVFF